MTDSYEHLFSDGIELYVLLHVDKDKDPIEGSIIYRKTTDSSLIIEDNDLARRVKAWMISAGVPVISEFDEQ